MIWLKTWVKKNAYQALPQAAKDAYITMRDDYRKDLQATRQALIDRINEYPTDTKTKGRIIFAEKQ